MSIVPRVRTVMLSGCKGLRWYRVMWITVEFSKMERKNSVIPNIHKNKLNEDNISIIIIINGNKLCKK
jgi:hypothetical protein